MAEARSVRHLIGYREFLTHGPNTTHYAGPQRAVHYSPEVITYFKSTGDGWQARMDGVLREYVAQQARRSS
jgi:hypothetical protein